MEIKCFASSSKGNCYTVDDGHTRLLIECGIAFREIQKALEFKVSKVSGCLVSHGHSDHCKAMKEVAKAGVDVFASGETFEAIGVTGHRYRTIKAREQFKIGSFTVLAFDTAHDCPGSLGFLLASGKSKLVYLTDSFYCRYRFKGLSHIMCEANYSLDILRENMAAGLVAPELKNRLLKSHMSLETCKEFLKANDLSRVQEIWLIHLSDGNSDSARFKREIQALTGKAVTIA